MQSEIVVALVAAVASLLVAVGGWLLSWRSQQKLTRIQLDQNREVEAIKHVNNTLIVQLRAELERHTAEQDARRDYEYEARKRLYIECEPLIFQLIEASEIALGHIKIMAEKAQLGDPKTINNSDDDTRRSREKYHLKATIYHLLVPVALYRIMKKRMTLVDFKLDHAIHVQYVLTNSLYRSFTDDFLFAQLHRKLPYNPYVDDWRDKRHENPQRYRRQGFPLGRLDNTLDTFITHDGIGNHGIISFGEFEEKLREVREDDFRSGLGIARDIFFDFYPAARPILWRTLISQVCIYRCILEVRSKRDMTQNEIIDFLGDITRAYKNEFDWRSPSASGEQTPVDEPFEVARLYFETRLRQQLESLAVSG
jgi:hypothetical protein